MRNLTLYREDPKEYWRRWDASMNASLENIDRFEKFCAIIQPILDEHPGWSCKDALGWLKNNGGLPFLDDWEGLPTD